MRNKRNCKILWITFDLVTKKDFKRRFLQGRLRVCKNFAEIPANVERTQKANAMGVLVWLMPCARKINESALKHNKILLRWFTIQLQLALRQLELECDWGLLDASILFCCVSGCVYVLLVLWVQNLCLIREKCEFLPIPT